MQVKCKEHGIGGEGEILMLNEFVHREDSQDGIYSSVKIYTIFLCDLK